MPSPEACADEMDRELRAEITRLCAALDAMTAERDAARAEALEDAASLASEKADDWWRGPNGNDYTATDMMDLAAAIRAMKEPKP